ncbi:unnamed protein product [Amoebophrya sp. A25]|nr:unnamed protein product [Amoebophrya sp. A25]|eukprot:GSA25T00018331001.1
MKDVAHCAGEKFCGSRLFETFERLCEDVNYTVRKCGSEQLPLMIETSRKFPECVSIAERLYNDNNRWVHLALCQNIGYILFALQKFGGAEAVHSADTLIGYYFKILQELKDSDNNSERSVYNEVRYHLGFTFSAVLEAILPLKLERFNDFRNFFFSLCESKELRTRQAVACSLWKIGATFLWCLQDARKGDEVKGKVGDVCGNEQAGKTSTTGKGDESGRRAADIKEVLLAGGSSVEQVEEQTADTSEAPDLINNNNNNLAQAAEQQVPTLLRIDQKTANKSLTSMKNLQRNKKSTSSSNSPSRTSAREQGGSASKSSEDQDNPLHQEPEEVKNLRQKLLQQFHTFTQDRDDIKLGLAKNVGNFEANPKYLQSLSQMMSLTDNWRLRHSIATISLPALCFEDPNTVFYYLLPTYLKLLHDGVALVRNKAAAVSNLVLKACCIEARKGDRSSPHSGSRYALVSPLVSPSGSKNTNISTSGDEQSGQETTTTGGSSCSTTAGVAVGGTTTPAPNLQVGGSSGSSSSSSVATSKNNTTSSTPRSASTSSRGRTPRNGFSLRTKRIVNHLRKTFKEGSFQNKITYLKMVDALIRDSSVSRRFVHLFLASLADLASDRVRHVRLQWALLVGPHLKPGIGKCSHHKKLIAAGRILQQAALGGRPPGGGTKMTSSSNVVEFNPHGRGAGADRNHGNTSSSTSPAKINRTSAGDRGHQQIQMVPTGASKKMVDVEMARVLNFTLPNDSDLCDLPKHVLEEEFSDTESLNFSSSSMMNSPAASTASTASLQATTTSMTSSQSSKTGDGGASKEPFSVGLEGEKANKSAIGEQGAPTGSSEDTAKVGSGAKDTTSVGEGGATTSCSGSDSSTVARPSTTASSSRTTSTSADLTPTSGLTPTPAPASEAVTNENNTENTNSNTSKQGGSDGSSDDDDEDPEGAAAVDAVFESSKREAHIEVKPVENTDEDEGEDFFTSTSGTTPSSGGVNNNINVDEDVVGDGKRTKTTSTSALVSSSSQLLMIDKIENDEEMLRSLADKNISLTSSKVLGSSNVPGGSASSKNDDIFVQDFFGEKPPAPSKTGTITSTTASASTSSNSTSPDSGSTSGAAAFSLTSSLRTAPDAFRLKRRDEDPRRGEASGGSQETSSGSSGMSETSTSSSTLGSSSTTATAPVVSSSSEVDLSNKNEKPRPPPPPPPGAGVKPPSAPRQPYHLKNMVEVEAWPEKIDVPLHEQPQFRRELTVPDQPLPPSAWDAQKERSKGSASFEEE